VSAPEPRFGSLLAMLAEADPTRNALTFDGVATTFGALWQGIEAFAGRLIAAGVGPGESVLLLLDNGPAFFVALYGCQRAGAVPVPLLARSGADRAVDLGRLCAATAAVVQPSAPPEFADALTGSGLRVLPAPAPGGPTPATPLPALPQLDDLALVQFTSGSTGHPKGVARSHRALLVNLAQLIVGMAIDERDVFVSWLPCHHDMGLIIMTMVPMLLRCRLVLLPTSARSLPLWLQAIGEHGGTVTAAPDFAYRWCLRFVAGPQRYDLSSLRVALNAAEPVRRDTVERFEAAFGLGRVLIAGYGLAEATVGVCTSTPGEALILDHDGHVSVGQPFVGIDLAILGGDATLAVGEVGEIAIRSPANCRGYLRDPEATARLHWRDGYLRSGDLGYLDADGRLFVVGRSKNVIVHQGRTLAPFEIELCADEARGVERAAAVGIDRGDLAGEQVLLFVELARGVRRAEHPELHRAVVGAVHRRLGFRPSRVYLVGRGTLPRTPNGKVRHRELREAHLRSELAPRILFGELPEPGGATAP
jgi:acyl-CoA synthetase (AMP-forming)/AMP-acid ligase II